MKTRLVGVKRRLAASEHASGLGDLRAVLLGRVPGLFLSVRLWAHRNRCAGLGPTVIPDETASALRISCRVKSGCRANQLQHPRAGLTQPGATIAAHPARACVAFSPPALAQRRALLTLTSNRTAAARALPPSAMKPITRSLLRGRGRHIASNGMLQPQPRQSAKA
jgi:hypothetical protein